MPELYPDDSTLLALEQDSETGVELIPTGQSPYYLQFRRLIQRLLLATRRANDLRIYADGPLSVGVRSGRCVIRGNAIAFPGAAGLTLTDESETYLWLDEAGQARTGAALPPDPTGHIPLARARTDDGAIEELEDLRGQTFLTNTDLARLSITATGAQISRAMDGIGPTVTAAALTVLTAGPDSEAHTLHRHTQLLTESDGETGYRLINSSDGPSANIALSFELPARLPVTPALLPDPSTGYLRQRYGAANYGLVGAVHSHYGHSGVLLTSQTGRIMGTVPITGSVVDVILSLGRNIEAINPADGITAAVKVNGQAVCATDPKIPSDAGSGFRSTARGHGTPAVVKTDGTQNVQRGDVLSLDLLRNATAVTTEAMDAAVLVVIRPDRPE